MTDNTKVNSYQEWLLDAIEITAEQLIQGLSYDKTIVCTVVDDSKKEQDEYKVFDGSSKFTAYAVGAKYKNGDSVYVNVPQGDFINDKFITGKQNNKTQTAYNYVEPFDKIIDLSGNINSELEEVGLVANGEDNIKEIATIELDEPIKSMTWLGLKADFRSMVNKAVFGSYGLKLELSPANGEKKCVLDSSSMFGNPYNFTTNSSQQMIYPIQNIDEIKEIRIYFYQNDNFTNIEGELIEVAEGSPNNLFVSNIYLCYGKDSSEITKDVVELISVEGTTYENEGEQKNINLRWIHKDGDKAYIVKANEHSELLKKYDIQWYRFALGAPAPDDWAGIYWQKIAEGPTGISENQLSCSFKTGNGKQERIKAIVYEKGDNYNTDSNDKFVKVRSETLDYIKEQSEEQELAKDFSSVVVIECDDGTNGNYPFYNQYGDLFDITQDDKIRTLSVRINVDGNGYKIPVLKGDEDKNSLGIQSIEWIFPQDNTMIVDPQYFDKTKFYKLTNQDDEDITEYIVQKNDKNDNLQYYYNNELIHIEKYKIYKHQPFGYQKKEKNSNGEEIITYWKYAAENEIEDSDITNDIKNNEYKKYYINNNNLYYEEDKIDNNLLGFCNIVLNPTYRIAQRYSESSTNNTIICKIKYADKIYIGSKELTFLPQGTMGTKYTMLVDFVDGKTAININHINTNDEPDYYKLKLQVYDGQNELSDNNESKYIWSIISQPFGYQDKTINANEEEVITYWKYPTGDETDNTNITENISINNTTKKYEYDNRIFIIKDNQLYYNDYLITTTDDGEQKIIDSIDDANLTDKISLNPECFRDINDIVIVQIKEKTTNLTTYFPIPLKSDDKYLSINGAKKVIYGSDGKPYYLNDEYSIYTMDDNRNIVQLKTVINIIPEGSKEAEIAGTQNDRLKPSVLYTKDAPLYAVQFKLNNQPIWTQPILVIQNTYPSTTINSWDGETLTVDTENGTILGTALAMGTKNKNTNQFTGVMLGDWSPKGDQSLAKSGLYGFKDGAQAFAFKEDGTAFIGAGNGRLEFNGNNAKINNVVASEGNELGYMELDFNTPKIILQGKKSNGTNNDNTIEMGFTGITPQGMLPYINLNGDGLNSTYPLQVGSYFKVKWDGTIYASNGTFSGTIYATDGTFSGQLEAASGTFKGELQAATGTFKGNIEIGDDDLLFVNGEGISAMRQLEDNSYQYYGRLALVKDSHIGLSIVTNKARHAYFTIYPKTKNNGIINFTIGTNTSSGFTPDDIYTINFGGATLTNCKVTAVFG